MKILIAISTVAVSLSANIAWAFDVTTHAAMTAKAMEQSKFGSTPNTSELMARLGLRDAEGVFGSRYIGFGSPLRSRAATSWEKRWMKEVRDVIPSLPTDFTMVGWMMRGAIREDDNTVETPLINQTDNDPAPVFSRVFGHFFNPIGNEGLLTPQIGPSGRRRGPTAPDWGLVTNANIPDGAFGSRENNYKISDAREAMWRALTLKTLQGGILEDVPFTTNIQTFDSYAAQRVDERKAYWAATFRTLGDTVHLLQDMGQPQHTRLDNHSGLACPNPILQVDVCVGGHASFFENYLKARTLQSGSYSLDESPNLTPPVPDPLKARATTRPQLNYAGYGTPTFATYRDFFATDTGGANSTGKGLANYSNRGFYSFGTNINSTPFPAPSPSGAGLVSETISGDAFVDMTGRKLAGSLKVLTGTVEDFADPSKTASPIRLSTEGLWDQFIQQYGGGQPRYSLNYYNYDAQADLLIPRAVAYSAGLIDYFFRGQLEITPPAEGIYSLVDHFDFSGAGQIPTATTTGFKGFKTIKLKLRNSTPNIIPAGGGVAVPQTMTGGNLVAVLKFIRNKNYTDDLNGESIVGGQVGLDAYNAGRGGQSEEIIVSARIKDGITGALLGGAIAVTNDEQTFVFEFDQELPINVTDVQLQVVYRGALGSEADAVVVQTVDISEPTYFTYMNATDYIKIGSSVFTRAEINAGTSAGAALRSQVRPTTCIDSMTDQLKDIPTCFQPYALNYGLKWGNAAGVSASVNLPNERTYHRFAMLLPPTGGAVINPIAATCGANTPIAISRRRMQTNDNGSVDLGALIVERGVRSFSSLACINIGDNAPLGADDRSAKMAPLTGVNLKPLATQSFGFGAP